MFEVDGYTSSAMLIHYLQTYNPSINIQWEHQEGKEHGVVAERVPDDTDLVILPDSSSNDFLEHEKLTQRGIDVIVLDHHEADRYSKHAIVVNNQLSEDFENKSFSAAGVVHKFLQALDDRLNTKQSDNYWDLAALGLIGDSMDMRSIENRYYTSQGLKKVKNPLIEEILKAQEYSTKGDVNISNISFYINPLFNACVRSGSMEEKNQVFEALLSDGTEQVYYERGKKYEPLTTNTVRMMKRVRVRQNTARDKGVQAIEEKIEHKNLLDNKFLIVEVTDILSAELSGLVANKLAQAYQRPVLLPRWGEEGSLNGSARGYDKGYIDDLRQYLLDTGLFEYARGHAGAFGWCASPNNLIEANNVINSQLKNVDIGSGVYKVDFEFEAKKLTKKFVEEVHSYRHLWGKGVDEPAVAVKNIVLNKKDIQLIGAKKNTLKFKYKSVEYIKFRISENEYEDIVSIGDSDSINITVLGKCDINKYMGKKNAQVIIEDYGVEEAENVLLF